MNAFTIKDLENLSGIKAHTIRVWEQRYSFLKPSRTDTNIRYYGNQELKTVLNISLLNKYGYKISHLDKMSEQELQSRILTLSGNDVQQEKIINELIGFMVDLDIDAFEKHLDGFMREKGADQAIRQIIFPFLQRIGVLWLTDHMDPAQEHLITAVIRQKLIVGIEGITTRPRSHKTVLLFLPEGEHHELGLLYSYFLLKTHGVKVLYLGADLPLKDLEFACKFKHPDFIYTHLTGITGRLHLEKFLFQIHQLLPHIPLVVSGQLARTRLQKIPSGIDFRQTQPEVLEFVSSL